MWASGPNVALVGSQPQGPIYTPYCIDRPDPSPRQKDMPTLRIDRPSAHKISPSPPSRLSIKQRQRMGKILRKHPSRPHHQPIQQSTTLLLKPCMVNDPYMIHHTDNSTGTLTSHKLQHNCLDPEDTETPNIAGVASISGLESLGYRTHDVAAHRFDAKQLGSRIQSPSGDGDEGFVQFSALAE